MFLLHHWSSPRRSLFLVVILALFLLLLSSCRSDPVAPTDTVVVLTEGIPLDDPDERMLLPKDIVMRIVERTPASPGMDPPLPGVEAALPGAASGIDAASTGMDAAPRGKDTTSPAMNAIDGGNGAIKERFDPDRGFVNINTTASGKLMGTIHLQGARPDSEFFVNVRVRYEDGTSDAFINIATLTTNSEGNGNAHVVVLPSPPGDDATLRRVAVRVRRTTPPNLLYLAVAWDVPLK